MKKIMGKILIVLLVFTMFMCVISAQEIGEKIGMTQKTNIVASINNYPLVSYSVDDITFIKTSVLSQYGFKLKWESTTKSSYITLDDGIEPFKPVYLPFERSRKKANLSVPILYTDIKVYVNGRTVETLYIDGEIVIPFQELAEFGTLIWDNTYRTTSLWSPQLPVHDYSEYFAQKNGSTPILTGDAKKDYDTSILIGEIFPQDISKISDREKLQKVYTWIMQADTNNNETNRLTFATSFKTLVNSLGFNCEIVDGNMIMNDDSLQPHSWNYVKIDDDYYWVDAYRDYSAWSNMGKPKNFALYYFLQSDENFAKTHEWKKEGIPTCTKGISSQNTLYRINNDLFKSDTMSISHPSFNVSDELSKKMSNTLLQYNGDTSFYLVTLDGEMSCGYNIDTRYDCASVVKAPYALYSYQQLEAGNGTYDEKMTYQQKHSCGRSGLIQKSAYGTQYTLSEILYYTIHESDNVGYYMLQDRFKISGYSEWLRKIECGRMVYPRNVRWGYVYPRELAKIWNQIYTYAQTSPYGKRLFQDFLEAKYNFIKDAHEKTYGTLSYPIAHKSGFNDLAYHDTSIVFTEIPYFITVMTESSGERKDKIFLRDMAILLNEVMKEYMEFKHQ